MLIRYLQHKIFLMDEVQLIWQSSGQGTFTIVEEDTQLGETAFSTAGEVLRVYHTEVLPEAEGRGLAKKMLEVMVRYARQHHLQVVPQCPYVLAQFKRHQDEYADLWMRK
jgi:uncharacterized protein